jgi:DnaK suppressor protein
MAKRARALGETERYDELKAMLDERRRVILAEVQGRIRGIRVDARDSRLRGTGEPSDTATLDLQGDIELTLIEGKAEVLNKVNEALARLEEGRYGKCCKCGDEIHETRLKALPFAVRCKDCEEERENSISRDQASHKGPPSAWLPKK